MQTLTFSKKDGPYRLLCLGAHCDDIEIGCGGTVLRLARELKQVSVTWVVFCSNEIRAREAASCADKFLSGVREKRVVIKNYRDGFLPYNGGEVKDFFEQLKKEVNPDLILTHYGKDRHQDHRLVSELTWNTWRDHFILEYEVPKYDGDLGAPNFFVPLSEDDCRMKVDHITSAFASQSTKHWFSSETFLGLARLRGMESCASEHYAEAFYSRKVVI
ncbi:MAG TPA: PIG-L deacetylase family protein [Bacteroidota bacterium]|nr:PIG-L deacetylase family protein [Bacteroidota bacterium]